MNLTRDRVQSIGWAAVLMVCAALTLALTFRVNAVRSQVRLADRQIVSLKKQKMFLETEFQTRANQQQLRTLNEVEFGYQAPTASQYIEGERQLAELGKARGPGAPEPIRVASLADVPEQTALQAMVSPLTGAKLAVQDSGNGVRRQLAASDLSLRLSRIEGAGGQGGASGADRE